MRDTLAVLFLVLLLRVPFLNQAIQGDDVDYLRAAQHAQIDPAHPLRFSFIYQGVTLSMQGHPHPPLNAWVLAALLAAAGDVSEAEYHVVYILFSLIAGLAALSLARRFCARPLLATVLFMVTPAFMINGNSLESDLPFLAFWLASIALFIKAAGVRSRLMLLASCSMMLLAAMAAFQSILLVPILALYLWRECREWKEGWAALLTVPAVLGGWQLFEKLTSEQLPAQVLASYFTRFGMQALANKARNAAALTVHLGAMIIPTLPLAIFRPLLALLPPIAGLAGLIFCIRRRNDFLAGWILLFFTGALILFFAGSARYLLPLAVPVAILLVNRAPVSYVTALIVLQACLGFALAKENYDHWDGYRAAIDRLQPDWKNKRVFSNTGLGMRFYAERAGSVPILRGQALRPGDLIVSSKLTGIDIHAPNMVRITSIPITSRIPLCIIGLTCHSAYSTADEGLLPFDTGSAPIDIVTVDTVAESKPALTFLPMNAPEAASQIVSGVYDLEQNKFRWIGRRALILLKPPDHPAPLEIDCFLPETAAARNIILSIDGTRVWQNTFARAGAQKITTQPVGTSGDSATLSIEVDRTVQSGADERVLGLILVAAGFR